MPNSLKSAIATRSTLSNVSSHPGHTTIMLHSLCSTSASTLSLSCFYYTAAPRVGARFESMCDCRFCMGRWKGKRWTNPLPNLSKGGGVLDQCRPGPLELRYYRTLGLLYNVILLYGSTWFSFETDSRGKLFRLPDVTMLTFCRTLEKFSWSTHTSISRTRETTLTLRL